jgi:hypothetical protein
MSLTKVTYSMIDGAPANVTDYGAIGDGIADDTAAFQAAINSGASRIIAPTGRYKITSTLNFSSFGQALVGASVATYGAPSTYAKTVLVHSFNGDLIRINYDTSVVARGRNQIVDINFESNDTYTGVAISVTSQLNYITRCGFYRFADGAIRVRGRSYGTYIENPSCDECGSNGAYDISGDADTGPSATDYNTITVVTGGIFESSATGAISLKNCDPFYIEDNYIEPFNSPTTDPMIRTENSTSGNTEGWIRNNYIGSLNGNNGFAISASGAKITVTGNHCINFPDGIYISAIDGSSVANNIVDKVSNYGIQLASAALANNGITVTGNEIFARSTGAESGIFLGNFVSRGTVTGNAIIGPFTYGIRLNACSNFAVVGNSVGPLRGGTLPGTGVREENTNTSNNFVSSNQIEATTSYVRSSWRYNLWSEAAAPTTGTWAQGDVVWNTGASAGGSPGWVCTTAGTPGTWKAMANLAP